MDNGQVESWDVYISALDWHFRSGDSIHGMLDVNPIYERLFEPFEISPGVVLPVGEYRFTRFRTNFFPNPPSRDYLGTLRYHPSPPTTLFLILFPLSLLFSPYLVIPYLQILFYILISNHISVSAARTPWPVSRPS